MKDYLKNNKSILVFSSQAFSLMHFRLEMMTRFIMQGYTVHAAAPEEETIWSERFEAYGIHYHRILLDRNGENPFHDIRGYFSIKKLIKNVKPNIVFAYQAKTIIYGSIAAHICGIDEIYVLIAGLGSAFRNQDVNWKRKLVKNILSLEYRVALRYAKTIFFQNHDDSALFIDGKLVDAKKVKYMNGSGVNLEHFVRRPMPKERRVLFVGRFIRDKGLYEFLEAARVLKTKYPDVVFEIVGYYDSNPTAITQDHIQPYIDDGSIINHGKTEDIYPFLERCYVFVLPSYHEGTPKSVLEAMAVGRPIVTTDAPGCKETVEDGINGFLVDVGNARLLADRIELLLNDKELADKMGKMSYRIAANKYDVNIVNEQLLKDMELK